MVNRLSLITRALITREVSMAHFFDEIRRVFEEEREKRKQKDQYVEEEYDDDGWGDDWEDEIYE